MKKQLCILSFFLLPVFIRAQNVGIGISTPLQKLHVEGGNFLITQPLTQTSTPPTAGQTTTMVNGVSTQFQTTDSTGSISDPGGPGGNYVPNLISNVNIPAVSGCIGFEVTISTMGLGTGDSLVISESSSWRNVQLAVGNNYAATGTYVFNTPSLFFAFKSNTDGSVGSGFTVVFKRKYDNINGQPQPSNQLAGNAFLYNPKYSRLQVGNSSALADFSTAIGNGNTVSSAYSFAHGLNNFVNGYASATAGYGNVVTGVSPTFAFGTNLVANSADFGGSQLVIGYYNAPSQGLLVVGKGSSAADRMNVFEIDFDGNTNVNRFTRLGKSTEGSPAIKVKKITGTGPLADGNIAIAHGLDAAKILSVSVLMEYGLGAAETIPPLYTISAGYEYQYQVRIGDILISNKAGNSIHLASRPVKILITYEE